MNELGNVDFQEIKRAGDHVTRIVIAVLIFMIQGTRNELSQSTCRIEINRE